MVETTNLSTTTVDADYVLRSINVSAYADGAAHTILFQNEYTDAGATDGDGEVFIDDVTIDPTATPIAARPAIRMHRTEPRQQKHR